MTAKRVATIVLLVFVAFSLIELVIKRVRLAAEEGRGLGKLRNGVVVCYFHGKTRCDNCREIEARARKAVQDGFAAELKEGTLEWTVVDFDEPDCRHFNEDFKLGGIPAVVLVEMNDGKPARWKNLTDVWQLVMEKDDKPFIEYVQEELVEFRRTDDAGKSKTEEPPAAAKKADAASNDVEGDGTEPIP